MAHTTHTPGPWEVRSHGTEEGSYVPIYTEDGLWIAEAMGRGGLRKSKVGPDKNDEIAFNAALIAAAPDLLEALVDALNLIQKDLRLDIHEDTSCVGRIKAAIAKATSTQQ